MPETKKTELRYKIIHDCLRMRKKGYTWKELTDKVDDKLVELGHQAVSERTIKNDVEELENRYGAPIERCQDGHKKIIKYEDINFNIPSFGITDEDRKKIEEAISILKSYEGNPQYDWLRFCLRQLASDAFDGEGHKFIDFGSNENLRGIKFLDELLTYISEKRTLKLKYKFFPKKTYNYKETEAETHIICPYLLKQYNNRWFLMAFNMEKNKLSNYALDRIVGFEPCYYVRYKEPEVDFEEYFSNVVGVTKRGREVVQEVLIRVSKDRYPYIKTKPIHKSQEEVPEGETDNHVVLKMNLCINKELEQLFLSYGDDLEVLSPIKFRESIAKKIDSMQKKYQL